MSSRDAIGKTQQMLSLAKSQHQMVRAVVSRDGPVPLSVPLCQVTNPRTLCRPPYKGKHFQPYKKCLTFLSFRRIQISMFINLVSDHMKSNLAQIYCVSNKTNHQINYNTDFTSSWLCRAMRTTGRANVYMISMGPAG